MMKPQPATDPDPVEGLVLDLVAWIAAEPRPYHDVMDAWRTSCPRLPVWEEAVDRGYLRRASTAEGGAEIHATPTGLAFLRANGRSAN